MKKTSILFALFLNLLVIQSLSAEWIVGFYTAGMGQPISEVPWNKITHLNLCCAAAGANGSLSQSWLDPSSFAQIRSSAQAANVKVVLSIGDSGVATNYFPNDTTPATVNTFVNNIAAYINNNGFDGVDLDWESSLNTTQYIDLMVKLRAAMPNKIISMDIGNWGGLETVAAAVHPSVNQMNVMCYDMAAGNGFSWHNAALLQAGDSGVMTCDWRMRAFTNAGVPASKLGVGIPAYGYAWGNTTQPRSSAGTFDGTQWWYSQIVGNPTWWNGGLNKRWNDSNKSDYLSVASTNQFVTYNDTGSIQQLVPWGKAQGYGGYMLLFLYQEYLSGATGDARFPLTAALYNAVGSGSTPPPSLVVPTITSGAALTGGTVGIPYSLTLTADGSNPMTWTVTAGTLPAGVSLASSTGVLSGTPGTAATSTFTIQAANSAGTNSKQFTLAVVAAMIPPVVTSVSPLPAGTVGTSYTQTATATGSSPMTWSVTAGSLPSGVSLAPTTGLISGTPGAAGSFTATIQAANSAGSNAKQLSLTVNATSVAPIINSASPLPAGTAGTAYSQTIMANGSNPIAWSVSVGALPAGLALGSSTGTIAGTPSAAGSFTFTINASNTSGNNSKQFTVTVNPVVPASSTYLSDMNWTSAASGWGKVQKNMSVAGSVMTLNKVTYAKGIGVNSISQVAYNLGGACSSFQSDIGIDDDVSGKGSVTFQVVADGVTLYQSGVLNGSSSTQTINVSLAGRNNLVLNVTDGGDNIHFDHADWANARLTCGAVATPTNYNLSDLNWAAATIGWGAIQKDASVNGGVITLGGVTYAKGIGTHAVSTITYNLGGACSVFQADVGVDDEVGSNGSVTFQVQADGVGLYQTSVLTGPNPAQSISVPVTGKQQLVLIAGNGGDDINFDHADWANARLTCTSKPQ